MKNDKDHNCNDTIIKTFRFRKTTVEGLKDLTIRINKDLNIKLSTNSIVELLIKDAIKEDKRKILKMINKVD
jgi:hypothetical protein